MRQNEARVQPSRLAVSEDRLGEGEVGFIHRIV